jgi:hypothetical protein
MFQKPEMNAPGAALRWRLTVPHTWITGAESPDCYKVRYTLMCEQRTHSHTFEGFFANYLKSPLDSKNNAL